MNVIAGIPPVRVADPGILWAPIASPTRLRFNGTSYAEVENALKIAFGQFPIRLKMEHMPVLKGMRAAAREGHAPYADLMTALQNIGELELTLVE